MHTVTHINPSAASLPDMYAGHAHGFNRAMFADRALGSVHMGAGVCYLAPGGHIARHLHSFEESLYVLSGEIELQAGPQASVLGPGHYALLSTGLPHTLHNRGAAPASWLEMQAPQPRPPGAERDTFFAGAAAPEPLPAGAELLLGYFDEAQLPQPGGPSQMEGFNPLSGVAIKMFVDRSSGAIHQSLFLIQYLPGARIDLHDHTFEESYLIVSGQVRAIADGKTYDLGPGDAIWTGVGCLHSFANLGHQPVRWIETQAPLPPAKEVFRFERDWAKFALIQPA
jgi:quercetin dioxygenase-like cupin family protein